MFEEIPEAKADDPRLGAPSCLRPPGIPSRARPSSRRLEFPPCQSLLLAAGIPDPRPSSPPAQPEGKSPSFHGIAWLLLLLLSPLLSPLLANGQPGLAASPEGRTPKKPPN